MHHSRMRWRQHDLFVNKANTNNVDDDEEKRKRNHFLFFYMSSFFLFILFWFIFINCTHYICCRIKHFCDFNSNQKFFHFHNVSHRFHQWSIFLFFLRQCFSMLLFSIQRRRFRLRDCSSNFSFTRENNSRFKFFILNWNMNFCVDFNIQIMSIRIKSNLFNNNVENTKFILRISIYLRKFNNFAIEKTEFCRILFSKMINYIIKIWQKKKFEIERLWWSMTFEFLFDFFINEIIENETRHERKWKINIMISLKKKSRELSSIASIALSTNRSTSKFYWFVIYNSNALKRVQVDLIDMREESDDKYKWILHVKNHFSKMSFLWLLRSKRVVNVAYAMISWLMCNQSMKDWCAINQWEIDVQSINEILSNR
jgi:hypothetical protein